MTGTLLRKLAWLLTAVAVAAATCVCTVTFLVPHLKTVRGSSMNPTLIDGDMLYGSTNPTASDVNRGDIIVFTDINGWFHKGDELVKRVVATGGDKVEFDALGGVKVNGEYVSPSIASGVGSSWSPPDGVERQLYANGCKAGAGSFRVPEGRVFMLGDNVNNSTDARIAWCDGEKNPTVPVNDIDIVVKHVIPLGRILTGISGRL